jgi:SAM-dependent methyltransferase
MVHWCRKVMDDATLELVKDLHTEDMDCFEISGTFWAERVAWRSYVCTQYPSFDLNHDVMPDQRFDMVIAEQVMEHVKYPYRGMRNIYSLVKPGGWALITTPFLIQIHDNADYTRWTALGMRYFMEECGFSAETIAAAQWGNRDQLIADFNACAANGGGFGWLDYVESEHSLHNEFCYPASVWALAQKPP